MSPTLLLVRSLSLVKIDDDDDGRRIALFWCRAKSFGWLDRAATPREKMTCQLSVTRVVSVSDR